MAKNGKYSRRKGHNWERELVKIFKELGFEFCRTARQESRLLDDSKIDLTNIPLLVQAKAGYVRGRPKYEKIYQDIKEAIKKNFPPEHEIHNKPIVLCHKIDGRRKEGKQWTFAQDDILKILELAYGKNRTILP